MVQIYCDYHQKRIFPVDMVHIGLTSSQYGPFCTIKHTYSKDLYGYTDFLVPYKIGEWNLRWYTSKIATMQKQKTRVSMVHRKSNTMINLRIRFLMVIRQDTYAERHQVVAEST